MRCLALRPEYRPASAAALAAELNRTSRPRTTAVLPEPARPPRRAAAPHRGRGAASSPGSRARDRARNVERRRQGCTAATSTDAADDDRRDDRADHDPEPQRPRPRPRRPQLRPRRHDALAATRAAIVAAQANGQIDPGQAEDLAHRLDDIARALDKPNAKDASHKVDDLRQRLDGPRQR